MRALCDDLHSPRRNLPAASWASIHVPPMAAGQRLSCRYADGGMLELEAECAADPRCVADACLDLLIDDCRGRARLLRALPANQYERSFAEAFSGAQR